MENQNNGLRELKAKLVRPHHEDQEISKIIFTGILVKTDNHSRKSFDLVDQVWMIMEEIFEKNAYKLTRWGILFSNKDQGSANQKK